MNRRRTVLLTSLGGVVAAAAAPEIRYYRRLHAVTSSMRDAPTLAMVRVHRLDTDETAVIECDSGRRRVRLGANAGRVAVGDYVVVDGVGVIGVLTPDEVSAFRRDPGGSGGAVTGPAT